MMLLSAVVAGGVVLSRGWWRPRLGPEAVLAARGDFSRHHASLFRDMAQAPYGDRAARFFDEVPGALDLWHAYLRIDAEAASLNVRDRTTARRAWENGPSGIEQIELVRDLTADDYDLARDRIRGNRFEPPNLDVLLALDFDRARRETLARPRRPEDLVALVRWGVPRSEAEAAISELPEEPGVWSVTRPEDDRRLRTRLILEDQSLSDPDSELRRRGYDVPVRAYDRPRWGTASPPPKVARFAPDRAMVRSNVQWADRALEQDPHDAEARAFLTRQLRSPAGDFHDLAVGTLVALNDPIGVEAARADLESNLGARVAIGIEECVGDAGARLLTSPAVREHRWPWVRILAAGRLSGIATSPHPAGASAYATNSCRDARLLARGKMPRAIGEGPTLRVLPRSKD